MQPPAVRKVLTAVVASCSRSLPRRPVVPRPRHSTTPIIPLRTFSSSPLSLKKSKAAQVRKEKSKARASDDPDITEDTVVDPDEVLEKARVKMQKATDWARAIAYEGVERARGRVAPALLDSVKILSPDTDKLVPLHSVASVTVKGQELQVNVFEDRLVKVVEGAIHSANLPGLSPINAGSATLRIPVKRPTNEQRSQLLKTIGETIEKAKVRVRTARTDGVNSVGGRGEEGADDVDKLSKTFVTELDEVLGKAKKEFAKA